jgi:hypothetical protein
MYDLGEGVTGWVAETSQDFRANSLEELHRHPAWRGEYNRLQGEREPNSFLALPLKVTDRSTHRERVIGVFKAEDIQRSENHPEPYFTDTDKLLCEMMVNVIAIIISLYFCRYKSEMTEKPYARYGTLHPSIRYAPFDRLRMYSGCRVP